MGFSDVNSKIMGSLSGVDSERKKDYFIYNKIIAFKGVIDGVGCSTVVSNVAVELARRGLNVCVIDTSIMNPAQYSLLKIDDVVGKQKDWFDLIMSEDTGGILKSSKQTKGVSILGFMSRTINDALSTYDNEEIVTVALSKLEKIYDVILIDVCGELTHITESALIHAHTIYQVWSDDYLCISNVDNFVTNMKFRCCSPSKMQYVVLNKMIVNTASSLSGLLKKYNFISIAEAPFSLEYYSKQCLGVPLSKIATSNEEINSISTATSEVCDKILGISKSDEKIISGVDIVNGRVEGTLTKKYLDLDEKVDEIVRNDMSSLRGTFNLSKSPLFRGMKNRKDTSKVNELDNEEIDLDCESSESNDISKVNDNSSSSDSIEDTKQESTIKDNKNNSKKKERLKLFKRK